MKVKFGMFITDGVGSVGGHTIQKNHYGLFARTKVVPANPQTTPQQDRRAQLQFLTQNWRALTLMEQTAWNDETVNYPRTNSLGDTYFMTGQTLYIGLNMNLWRIGESFITLPVNKVIPPSFDAFVVDCNVRGTVFTLSEFSPVTDGDTKFIVYASIGLSPGKFYVSTKLRSIASHDLDGSGTYNFDSDYWTYFPSTVAGTKVFVKVLTIHARCGCAGLPVFADCIVDP